MFNNNPRLRGAGERCEMTPELVKEYFKCAEDIVHFAEKYFYIRSIDSPDGKHKISLFDYQKKALKIFTSNEYDGRKNVILLTPRQMGKCLIYKELCQIRNKKTGEIKQLPIGEIFDYISNGKN